MIKLIELLQKVNTKKEKYRTGYIDYSHNSYCKRCDEKKDFDQVFCDYCGRKLRHRPLTKHAKYWEKELKYVD